MDDLTFIQEDDHIKLVVACHESTELLEEQMLRDAFSQSAFSKCFLLEEELPDIVILGNEVISSVQDKTSPPSEFTYKIATVKDGVVTIKIAVDKMSAKAQLEMPWGGKELDMDSIIEACKKMGVSFGLKRSKVEALLEQTFSAEPGELLEGQIALGKDPKNGKNAFFKSMVELFADKIRRPLEIEGGKVDLKDLGQIETVKPGEKIYQKIPLTLGTPGKNVMGEVLPAAPGEDIPLYVSAGTVIDENDHNILRAKREGLARLFENRMEVDDVYSLPELTPKQGHVKFNGTVIIFGDVAPEMKIVASGDVFIGGFVESASIRCRGELTVVSGVSGKPLDEPTGDREFNCLLESGNRVNVSFANQVDILAKRDVFVHKQLSHCNVQAASMKIGQGRTPKGQLTGGHCKLSKGLELGTLGAPSDTVTEISLNRTFDIFKEKEQKIWQNVEPYVEQLEVAREQLKKLFGDEQRNAKKLEIAKLQGLIDKQNYKRKVLSDRRKDYMSKLQITVNNTLFGGLKFEIGDKSKLNEQQKGPSIIRLDEYQLLIEPKTKR